MVQEGAFTLSPDRAKALSMSLVRGHWVQDRDIMMCGKWFMEQLNYDHFVNRFCQEERRLITERAG